MTIRIAPSLLLAFALTLAGCGKKEEPAAGSAAPAPKVYIVGTDAAYAPFESQDDKGRIVGFDIDVINAVAAKGGFAVKIVNTPWEGIFNALAQGDRDLVVSTVTITEERKQTLDFSTPYFEARQLIAVKQGSKVARFDDLRGLRVGVQTGTTGDEAASRLLGKADPHIVRFDSTVLALKELEAGGVDAVVADNGVIEFYVQNNPGGNFRPVSDDAFVHEQYGIAVRKGNAELLAKINQGLAAIQADGSLAAIHAKYFGQAAAAPAPSASK